MNSTLNLNGKFLILFTSPVSIRSLRWPDSDTSGQSRKRGQSLLETKREGSARARAERVSLFRVGDNAGLTFKNKTKTEQRAAPPSQPGLRHHAGYCMERKVPGGITSSVQSPVPAWSPRASRAA